MLLTNYQPDDCILPTAENSASLTAELLSLLTSDDIMTLCVNNFEEKLPYQQQTTCSLNAIDESNSAAFTADSVLSSNMSIAQSLNNGQTNISSHSYSDSHSSPNPSINNVVSIEQSTLLKMLQQSLSPSSQYSPITMFNDDEITQPLPPLPLSLPSVTTRNQINNNCSNKTQPPLDQLSLGMTLTCYQLIDEALKNTQSSLGLIWSKFDSNHQPIMMLDQPFTAINTDDFNSVLNNTMNVTNNTNNNIDIFPYNLDSNALDMLTSEKKKTLKRKQSIENSLPSKKQSITFEILPMTTPSPPPPIQKASPQTTTTTKKPITTDRRRRYKVRFGPNMFDEISIKKNHKLSHEVVRK